MARALRAGLTVAVTGLAVALPASPAASAAVFYQAQTAATAVHLTLTQKPASSIVTASLVDDAAAYAAGAFDSSGGSDAQGASLYPGRLVVQGPALFCSLVIDCPVAPPDYPLLASASWPRTPRSSAAANQPQVGTGPFVVTPAQSSAVAGEASNDASSATGRVSVLAGTPVAVGMAASSAASSVRTTAAGLVVHVESVAHDVTLAGLVKIRQIRAVDDITIAPGRRPVDRPSVTVSGVTVAGQGATIDATGLHVAGRDGPSLQRKVDGQGLGLRLVGVDRVDTATGARSGATGLQVDFSLPVADVPYVPNPLPAPFDQIPGVNANGTYVGQLTIGAVGAVGGLSHEGDFALGGVGAPGVPLPPSASRSAAGAAGSATGSVPGQTAPAPQTGSPQVAPAPGLSLRGVLDALSKEQTEMLYAVLALGTVGLFVGWRGAVLLRRHRAPGWRRR